MSLREVQQVLNLFPKAQIEGPPNDFLKPEGLPEENPKGGIQSGPLGTDGVVKGTPEGDRFTALPQRIFHRLSFFQNSSRVVLDLISVQQKLC